MREGGKDAPSSNLHASRITRHVSTSSENVVDNPLQPTRAVQVFRGIEEAAPRAVQVELQQNGNALRAALVVTNGVEAVGVGQGDLPGIRGRAIDNPAARAGVPMTRLLQTFKVIHVGGGNGER